MEKGPELCSLSPEALQCMLNVTSLASPSFSASPEVPHWPAVITGVFRVEVEVSECLHKKSSNGKLLISEIVW